MTAVLFFIFFFKKYHRLGPFLSPLVPRLLGFQWIMYKNLFCRKKIKIKTKINYLKNIYEHVFNVHFVKSKLILYSLFFILDFNLHGVCFFGLEASTEAMYGFIQLKSSQRPRSTAQSQTTYSVQNSLKFLLYYFFFFLLFITDVSSLKAQKRIVQMRGINQSPSHIQCSVNSTNGIFVSLPLPKVQSQELHDPNVFLVALSCSKSIQYFHLH